MWQHEHRDIQAYMGLLLDQIELVGATRSFTPVITISRLLAEVDVVHRMFMIADEL